MPWTRGIRRPAHPAHPPGAALCLPRTPARHPTTGAFPSAPGLDDSLAPNSQRHRRGPSGRPAGFQPARTENHGQHRHGSRPAGIWQRPLELLFFGSVPSPTAPELSGRSDCCGAGGALPTPLVLPCGNPDGTWAAPRTHTGAPRLYAAASLPRTVRTPGGHAWPSDPLQRAPSRALFSNGSAHSGLPHFCFAARNPNALLLPQMNSDFRPRSASSTATFLSRGSARLYHSLQLWVFHGLPLPAPGPRPSTPGSVANARSPPSSGGT